jgi:acetyl-CoA C-acetyltransferase
MRAIKSRDARVAIGVGSDNLGRMPYIVAPEARMGARIGHIVLYDNLYAMGYADFAPNTVFAGQVALEYGISREMQDEWALRSQQCWGKADAEGKFKEELIPIEIPQKKGDPITFNRDEGPRPSTTLEALSN